jgi:hypothetical protein
MKKKTPEKTNQRHCYELEFKVNKQPIMQTKKELEELEKVVLRLKKLGITFQAS